MSELSDIKGIVDRLNGKLILLYEIGEYDVKDIIKVFKFIGIEYKIIKEISDVKNYTFDMIITSPTTYNITHSLRDIVKYNIDNKKILIINPDGYIDYEILDILDCVVMNSPLNFIEFIRIVHNLVESNDNSNT